MTRRFLLVLVTGVFLQVGCSPSLSPLYRDFEHNPEQDSLLATIEQALIDAEWELDREGDPHLLTTEPRTFRHWWIYRVEASLQVAQVDGNYVRVLINPYRVYFTGRRSKMPFLKRGLGKAVLKDLRKEFEEEGLIAVGSVVERDKKDRGDS